MPTLRNCRKIIVLIARNTFKKMSASGLEVCGYAVGKLPIHRYVLNGHTQKNTWPIPFPIRFLGCLSKAFSWKGPWEITIKCNKQFQNYFRLEVYAQTRRVGFGEFLVSQCPGIRAVHVVENETKIRVVNNPILPAGVDRTILIMLAPPLHGGTALFTLFMSHPNVATLCRAGSTKCEGLG